MIVNRFELNQNVNDPNTWLKKVWTEFGCFSSPATRGWYLIENPQQCRNWNVLFYYTIHSCLRSKSTTLLRIFDVIPTPACYLNVSLVTWPLRFLYSDKTRRLNIKKMSKQISCNNKLDDNILLMEILKKFMRLQTKFSFEIFAITKCK